MSSVSRLVFPIFIPHGVASNSPGSTDPLVKVLPFSKVPGPTAFELIRSLIPGGKYYNKDFNDVIKGNREKYGDLFKFPAVLGGGENLVFTHDPDHFQTILRTEGRWPSRKPLKTMIYYRTKVRPEFFGKYAGLANSQGKDWADFRTVVNPPMAQPKNTKIYIPQVDAVARDFVERIYQIRNVNSNEVPDNFEEEVNKFTLESIALIAMDTRLGLMAAQTNERALKFIGATKAVLQLLFELEMKPSLWRIVKTPKLRELIRNFDIVTNISNEIIEETKARLEKTQTDNSEQGVLAKLLKIDPTLAKVMAIDMLFGGVDTTSAGIVGILYLLAKNPDKQETLRRELLTIMPEKDTPLTTDKMTNLPYLRACLKEGLRILPPVGGNVRDAGQDLTLNGYHIPKGTTMIMSTATLQREDKHFPNAAQFEPERWLKIDGDPAPAKSAHPFIYIPFGFGPRMCVARRFAEMEIETLTARIVRNFQIEWHHSDLKFITKLVNVPITKLKFTFKDI